MTDHRADSPPNLGLAAPTAAASCKAYRRPVPDACSSARLISCSAVVSWLALPAPVNSAKPIDARTSATEPSVIRRLLNRAVCDEKVMNWVKASSLLSEGRNGKAFYRAEQQASAATRPELDADPATNPAWKWSFLHTLWGRIPASSRSASRDQKSNCARTPTASTE